MLWLNGLWLDGKKSQGRDGVLGVADDGRLFRDVQREPVGTWQTAKLTPRLGNVPRTLSLANGYRFIASSPAQWELVEKGLNPKKHVDWLYRFESSWRAGATALLLLILVAVGTYQIGVPSLASYLAPRLPSSILDASSEQLLTTLPITPSQLPEQKRAKIHEQFERLLLSNGLEPDNFELRLHRMESGEANAFALPSGDIILLDDLVNLAEQDDEWLGVLAHEVAHVELLHGIRGVLQTAAGSMLVTLLIGDMTAATGVMIEFPRWLTEQGYSRDFEREADVLGAQMMLNAGRNPAALADMLERLDDEEHNHVSALFRSHPGKEERIERLRQIR